MVLSLDDIIVDISSGHQTDIHIWDKLKHYISEYWDGEAHTFEQVVQLTGQKFGSEMSAIMNTAQYFEVLENNFSDKNDILAIIINVTGYLKYYTENGSVNVERKLKEFRDAFSRVRQKCIENGVFHDKYFVGRDKEVQLMTEEICNGNKQGILVCGMGGMGKTSLSRTVCYRLRQKNWETIRIDLGDQCTFRHFLRETVYSIKEIQGLFFGPEKTKASVSDVKHDNNSEEENRLQLLFFDHVKNRMKRKYIFLFDNIDNIDDKVGHAEEKRKVLNFFQTFLERLGNDSQVRLIVTSRDNFLSSEAPLELLMFKVEVRRLSKEDATDLVRRCTTYFQTILSDKDMEAVVDLCGACPFAMRVTCDFINNSFSHNQGIFMLKARSDIINLPLMNMDAYLNQPYQKLKEQEQIILMKLSLFGTSKFDLKSARFIVYGDLKPKNDSKYENIKIFERYMELKFKLLVFRRQYLLEIDNEYDAHDKEITSGYEESMLSVDDEIYSFHPLVEKFLKENAMEDKMKKTMNEAINNYMIYFSNVVSSIGEHFDADPLKAGVEATKLHSKIRKYMSLMESHGDLTSEQSSLILFDDIKGRNNIYHMICDEEQHLWFMKKIRDKCEPGTLGKCAWDIEYVTAVIENEKWFYGLDKLCTEINEFLDSFEKKCFDKTEKNQVMIFQGRMQYNEGLMKMDSQPEESLKAFQRARNIFETESITYLPEIKIYLADILNCLGCLKYRNEEPDIAIQYHRQSISTLEVICALHQHTITSLANIGACHFKLGAKYLRDNDTDKKGTEELRECVKCYTHCMDMAIALRNDTTDKFVKLLKNRGNANAMLKEYEDAELDYSKGLSIIRKLHPSPSRHEILMLHAHGDILHKMILERERKKPSGFSGTHRTEKHVEGLVDIIQKGLEIYDEVQSILKPAKFPKDDPIFKKISRNHLQFLKDCKEDDRHGDIEIFYTTYHFDDTNSIPSPAFSSSSGDSNDGQLKEICDSPRGSSVTSLYPEEEISTDTNLNSTPRGIEELQNHSNNFDNNRPIEQMRDHSCFNFPVPEPRLESSRNKDDTSTETVTSDRTSESQKRRHYNWRKSSSGVSSFDSISSKFVNRGCCDSQKSSSGVSSLDTITSERVNERRSWITSRGTSSIESSIDDDVFTSELPNDGENEVKIKTEVNQQRPTLGSFGSGSLTYSIDDDNDMYFDDKDRKRRAVNVCNLKYSSSKKQRQESWLLTEKLTQQFEDRSKETGTQTEPQPLDNLLDELEQHIPTGKSKIKIMMKNLKSGAATLGYDRTGRPIIHYKNN